MVQFCTGRTSCIPDLFTEFGPQYFSLCSFRLLTVFATLKFSDAFLINIFVMLEKALLNIFEMLEFIRIFLNK